MAKTKRLTMRDRFAGCLLGGAVGDALGEPVEFDQVVSLDTNAQLGHISDDTQMTLFTAEGLLTPAAPAQCEPADRVWEAYLRWELTQESTVMEAEERWECEVRRLQGLLSHPELWVRRAPGNTCLSALRGKMTGYPQFAINDSKGSGTVMRVAPCGLYALSQEEAFRLGMETGALTHGHPTAWLSSGYLSVLLWALARGSGLRNAITTTNIVLDEWVGCSPKRQAQASELRATLAKVYAEHNRVDTQISDFGEGWTAEEALAMALFAALRATDYTSGVLLAVNHGGDSDTVGAIAGSILGAIHGVDGVPATWLWSLELREVIKDMAGRLYKERQR